MNDELIIECPEMQSRGMRWLYALLTSLLWFAWIYLVAPVINLVAWAVGIRHFTAEVLLPPNPPSAQDLLLYTGVAVALLVSVLAWSFYNGYRFRGIQRRKGGQPVTLAQEAAHYGLTEPAVQALKQGRRVHMAHTVDGRPQANSSEPALRNAADASSDHALPLEG